MGGIRFDQLPDGSKLSMAVTITAVERIGTRSYRWQWTGTGPYTVYRDGRAIAEAITSTQITVEGATASDIPALEIVESSDAANAQSVLYPPFLTLQWTRVESASFYQVEEYTGGQWVLRARVLEQGLDYYSYDTGLLEDGATHTWRVRPVDSLGGGGRALEFVAPMVRNPAPPAALIRFNGSSQRLEMIAA